MGNNRFSKTMIPVISQRGEQRFDCTDLIVSEKAMTIFINDERIATLMCTPESLKELAVGFLHSEGILTAIEDLESVSVDMETGIIRVGIKNYSGFAGKNAGYDVRYSGAGVCGNPPSIDPLVVGSAENAPIISEETVITLMDTLQEQAVVFRKTGGTHCAALADPRGIIVCYEDISRNNALDKIVGHTMICGIDAANKIIVFSGRISSEIARKVCRLKCSVLIARSAPTDMALSLARQWGITVAGFTRGECFNLYTHPERIKTEAKSYFELKKGEKEI